MSFKSVPAVLVLLGLFISTVIAQQAPTAVPSSALRAVAPKAGNDPFSGASPVTEPELVVLRLRSADAQAVSDMLRNLLSPTELDAVRPTVDPRSNALILRGPKADVERVLELVKQLDSEPASEKLSVPLSSTAGARVRWSSQDPYAVKNAANSQFGWAPQSRTAAEVKLMQDCARLESQSLEAAKAYRKGTESLGEKHPQQTERREQIKNLVEKSFDARQALQNQELKQLQERMAKVEQSLAKRAQNRSEIVGKRTKELLEEDRDLEWNASNVPALPAVSATPQGVYVPRLVTGPDGRAVIYDYEPTRYSTPNPLGPPTIAPSGTQPFVAVSPSVTLPPPVASNAPGSYGPALIPAPLATQPSAADGFALPAGANQRRAFVNSKVLLQQMEVEIAELKKRLKPEELEQDLNYQAATRRLQSTKRSFETLKREFEAQTTLLQLDLQAAEAELATAQEEYEHKSKLRKSNSATDEELRRSRGAIQQAQIRVSRAKVVLELHQVAMQSE